MVVDSILVLGAGELGTAVLRSLAGHPQKGSTRLAVLKRSETSHDKEKQRQNASLTSQGVEILTGNVLDDTADELSKLFAPFDTIINCNGMTMPPSVQLKIARSALQSGVRRYFPWQFGIDYDLVGRNSSQDLFDAQLDVRELLRGQSEMEWVIISTGLFTSFLSEPTFGVINATRDRVTALGSWENRVTVIAPGDIGRVVTEIALMCPDVSGVIYAAGDTVSMAELANVVEKVMGASVQRVLKDVTRLKEELALDPENGIKKYRVVFGEGIGVGWDNDTSFNAPRGISTQNVEEWAWANLTNNT